MPDTLITWKSGDDCTAVVRGFTGVFDTGCTDGRWWCSCAQPQPCIHAEHVAAAREDARHSDELNEERAS